MKRKGFKSIMVELSVMVIVAVLISSFVVTGYSVISTVSNNKVQVQEYKNQLTTDIKRELKNHTQIAVSIIEEYHKKQESGEMTEEEAKKAAADVVRELRYDDDNGYFWIDTVEGVNVVLLGRDTEGQSRWDATDPDGRKYIQEMIKNGQQKGGGYTNLMFPKPDETEPLPKINYTVTYEPYQWVLGTGVWVDSIDEMSAAYEKSNATHLRSTIRNMILVLIALLIIMGAIAVYLGKQIATPIKSVTKLLKRMSDGDLSTFDDQASFEKHALTRRDEIGSMAHGLVKFHATLRELIIKIAETTEYVASAAEELSANAQQSADASDLVAQSITTVAEACANQGGVIDAAGENTTAFSSYMGTFSEKLVDTNQQIDSTNKAARNGKASIDGAISQMHIIEDAVASTSEVVNDLGEQIGSIGTIVNTISEIASQTNLLSLNASIEAARAGESGRGFAVVAEQIKKLAEQSDTSSHEIDDTARILMEDSTKAVELMNQMQDIITSQSESMKETQDVVASVLEQIENSMKSIDMIKASTDKLESSRNQVVSAVDELSEIALNNVEGTKKTHSETEEVADSFKQVSDSAEKLRNIAGQLAESVEYFKI